MTSEAVVGGPGAGEPPGWEATAARIARRIAREDFPRGDLAALRRMVPGDGGAPAYWRLMAEAGLPGSPAVERKWALVLQGIALMTPTAGRSPGRSAHAPEIPVGRALFLGGDPRRNSAFYSEMRLNRLLAARGPAFHALLARMFRMLASAGVSFDWREMARLILSDGYDEEPAEQARRRIARAYYEAERRSASAGGHEVR